MPHPIVPSASALLRALACGNTQCPCHRAERAGHGLTHCPAHDDEHPSLSVTQGRVAALWKCWAGCDRAAVTQAIRGLRL